MGMAGGIRVSSGDDRVVGSFQRPITLPPMALLHRTGLGTANLAFFCGPDTLDGSASATLELNKGMGGLPERCHGGHHLDPLRPHKRGDSAQKSATMARPLVWVLRSQTTLLKRCVREFRSVFHEVRQNRISDVILSSLPDDY